MIHPRPHDVATALEARHPGLRLKRWGEEVAGFGHTPVQAEGTLSARPFFFRYRHDHATLAVWPTGTQHHSYAALPAGEALVKVGRDDVTGDPYSGDLTAEQMIETLGALLDEAAEQLPGDDDVLATTTLALPASLTTDHEARAFTDTFEPDPEEIRAVPHPEVVPAEAVRAVIVDCAGAEKFTADAVGQVAERLDLRFNRIYLVNTSVRLAEAFSEESVSRTQQDRMFAAFTA